MPHHVWPQPAALSRTCMQHECGQGGEETTEQHVLHDCPTHDTRRFVSDARMRHVHRNHPDPIIMTTARDSCMSNNQDTTRQAMQVEMEVCEFMWDVKGGQV